MRNDRIPAWALCAAAGASLATLSQALAIDFTWIGSSRRGGDGVSFTDPLNWSPKGVPGIGDAAIFSPVGGNIMMPGGLVAIDRLRAGGGPLDELFVSIDLDSGLLRLLSPDQEGNNRSLLVGPPETTAFLGFTNGTVQADAIGLGTGIESLGVLDIGSDALLSALGDVRVGEAGTGSIYVFGQLLTGTTTIGDGSNSHGLVNCEDAAALWLNLGDLRLALGGTGMLSVTDGAVVVTAGDLAAAILNGSQGTLTLDGVGSAIQIDGRAWLGGDEDGPGGVLTATITDTAVFDVADELRIWSGAALTATDAIVEARELHVTGGYVELNDGAAAISNIGAAAQPGLFVAINDGNGVVSVTEGGRLLTTSATIGGATGATALVSVEESDSFFHVDSFVLLGWEPVPWGRTSGEARLQAVDGGVVEIDGMLTIRQGGVLRLDNGEVIAEVFDATGDSIVEAALVTPDFTMISSGSASLDGGLFLELPGEVPPVDTEYPIVGAFDLNGTFSVTVSPLLPGFRYIAMETLPGKEHLEVARVAQLEAKLGLNPPVPSGLDGAPNAIAVGFFDGNPAPDAVVTIPGGDGVAGATGTVALLINTTEVPGGPPTFVVGATAPTGADPTDVKIADLDGDLSSEIIVCNSGDGTIAVYRTNALSDGGGLILGEVIVVGGSPKGTTIGDFNGDGKNDIAVANEGGNRVDLVLNDGEGGFVVGSPLTGVSQPRAVRSGDWDNDKDTDIIVIGFGGGGGVPTLDGAPSAPSVLVYWNKGKGQGFAEPVPYEVGAGPVAVADADLDGDGRFDVVSANFLAGTLSVLAGDPNSQDLHPAVDIPAAGFPTAIAIADFDNDLNKDPDIAFLVVDEFGQPALNVYRNDSTPGHIVLTLLTNVQEILGLPSAIASGNADLKGPPDLVSAGVGGDKTTGFITVFVASPNACPADLNEDGVVNGEDLGLLLAAFDMTGALPADLNGDNIVNGLDVEVMFAAWGECPQ